MACLMTISGIPAQCDINLSGVKKVYLADWNNVADVSVGNTGTISAITMEASAKFAEYVPAKNTGALTKTLTKNESTGTMYYTNEVTMNFNKMNQEKRAELNELAKGQIAAIVEDANGILWYLGMDNYATASVVTGQTGAGLDDGNFYSITITDYSKELPHVVDAGVLTNLV